MSEHAWTKSRLGWLHLQGNEAGLQRLVFADKPPTGFTRSGPFTRAALESVERYFAGELSALGAVAVAPAGTTFQRAVWRELSKLKAGEFVSYAELAERVGRPKAVRAVGQATAKNPVAVVIPCHRVVSSDGSLGGYAWGRERKAWLLEHERAPQIVPRPKTPARKRAAAAPSPLPLFEALRQTGLSLA